MEILKIIIAFGSLSMVTSILPAPRNFYTVDEKRADLIKISEDEVVDMPKIRMSSRFPFFGKRNLKDIMITKNGLLGLGDQTSEFDLYYGQPRPYPISKNTIAPLWTMLSLEEEGMVLYQETTKPKILEQAVHDVRDNFKCSKDFLPTSVLIVTWHNMKHIACDETNDHQHCVCLRRMTPHYCECYYDYSDQDFCRCLVNNRTCPCAIAMSSKITNKYCDCLEEYNDPEWCECMQESYDYENYCDCIRDRGGDRGPCICAYYDYLWAYPDVCACMIRFLSIPYVHDECRCLNYYSESYCFCVYDYKDAFYTTEQSNNWPGWSREMTGPAFDFCNCATRGQPLSACFCASGRNTTTTYCTCLSNYEDLLVENGLNYTAIHTFCLCMAELGDTMACGCDSCPDTRSLEMDEDDITKRNIVTGNTFQAVLITNGVQSFLMFNYGSIDISPVADGHYPAIVGAERYRSSHFPNPDYYFNHRFSNTNRLTNLLRQSNVRMRGRWMYRVDREPVQEPKDCN